nr:hypothetical protein [Trentepohlia sp. YN1242]
MLKNKTDLIFQNNVKTSVKNFFSGFNNTELGSVLYPNLSLKNQDLDNFTSEILATNPASVQKNLNRLFLKEKVNSKNKYRLFYFYKKKQIQTIQNQSMHNFYFASIPLKKKSVPSFNNLSSYQLFSDIQSIKSVLFLEKMMHIKSGKSFPKIYRSLLSENKEKMKWTKKDKYPWTSFSHVSLRESNKWIGRIMPLKMFRKNLYYDPENSPYQWFSTSLHTKKWVKTFPIAFAYNDSINGLKLLINKSKENEIGIYSLANYFASSEFLNFSSIPRFNKHSNFNNQYVPKNRPWPSEKNGLNVKNIQSKKTNSSLRFYEGNNLMPLKFNNAFKFNFKNMPIFSESILEKQQNEKKMVLLKNLKDIMIYFGFSNDKLLLNRINDKYTELIENKTGSDRDKKFLSDSLSFDSNQNNEKIAQKKLSDQPLFDNRVTNNDHSFREAKKTNNVAKKKSSFFFSSLRKFPYEFRTELPLQTHKENIIEPVQIYSQIEPFVNFSDNTFSGNLNEDLTMNMKTSDEIYHYLCNKLSYDFSLINNTDSNSKKKTDKKNQINRINLDIQKLAKKTDKKNQPSLSYIIPRNLDNKQ